MYINAWVCMCVVCQLAEAPAASRGPVSQKTAAAASDDDIERQLAQLKAL